MVIFDIILNYIDPLKERVLKKLKKDKMSLTEIEILEFHVNYLRAVIEENYNREFSLDEIESNFANRINLINGKIDLSGRDSEDEYGMIDAFIIAGLFESEPGYLWKKWLRSHTNP